MVHGTPRWHSPAGGFVLQMQALDRTGRPITQEYIDQYGIEAYAWFDREVFIDTFGMNKYMKEYCKLEKAGEWGTWEPGHQYMMGDGIVGIENLGGDLEKVIGIWTAVNWATVLPARSRTIHK